MWAERLANEWQIPLVPLVDGTGGGGSVKSLEQMGFTYVPFVPGWELIVDNLASVPVVAAALGPVAGLGAARVVASHFSVIVKDTSQLFIAGPPVVAAPMGESPDKEALGGARAQTRAGRSTTRPRTRTTPSPSCAAFSPTSPATCGRRRRSSPSITVSRCSTSRT